MKAALSKRWLWCGLLLLGSGAVLLFPDSRWRIVGWVKGESFYKNRPTCYWRERVKHLQMSVSHPEPSWFRDAWHQLQKRLGNDDATNGRDPFYTEFDQKHYVYRKPDMVGVPVLIELVLDSDATVASYARSALGQLGQDALAAAPALAQQMDHPDPERRCGAAWALAIIQPGHPRLLAVLLPFVQTASADPGAREHRRTAVSALRYMESHARPAFPVLLELWRRDRDDFDHFDRHGPSFNILGEALLLIDRAQAEAAGVHDRLSTE